MQSASSWRSPVVNKCPRRILPGAGEAAYGKNSRPVHLCRIAECLKTRDEIIRHAKVESRGVHHFQREISFALALDFLGAGELEFAVVANIVANHFFKNVVD